MICGKVGSNVKAVIADQKMLVNIGSISIKKEGPVVEAKNHH